MKKLILISATVLSLSVSAVYAHTANITVHQANELYTRLAAENRGVNYDNAFGYQCVDIPGDLTLNYVGKPIYGNAIDLLDSARAAGYEIVPADRSPRVGDIFVMDAWPLYGHGYGHTGYIWQVNPDGSFETVEQNVGDDANLYYGTPARLVHRTRDYMLGYIRLAYQK
ncbi:CHAP domain-containing protein [Streptococcus ferus]|uniref:CHAP domain-containing protein n=1 Tax=Streptococcus ferus TaxID=1345 RepID=UPI0035A0D0CD